MLVSQRKSKVYMHLIGIGANLASQTGRTALQTCESAADALNGVCGLRLVGLSGWYETEPVPPSGQPFYINGIAHLEGDVAPEGLLRALQGIESAYGRERSVPNAARTLDLDIVAMGGQVRSDTDPILPHPRMHQRAFVLIPLLDVAPDWLHPALGVTAQGLLSRLDAGGIRRVKSSHLRNSLLQPN